MTTTQGSYTVFRLPRSHWHCQVKNFTWDGIRPRNLQKHYMDFLARVVAGEPRHLLLTGAPGIGKTHLGVAAYRWLAAEVGTELTTWLNVPAFCAEVKSAYSEEHDPLREYGDARRLVVLDDLFGRPYTKHEAEQIVYRLLDIAYQNGAAMILTMNQDAQVLTETFPPHEVSRIMANAIVIPMTADKDWRRG